MKGRIRPLKGTLNKSVLDWIVMKVVHVPFKVILIVDGVLPKSPLPDAALFAFPARRRHRKFSTALCEIRFGEFLLDAPPAHGKATVAGRQLPYCVQVIRQKYNCGNLKRMVCLDGA